jgi:hypothetical protein
MRLVLIALVEGAAGNPWSMISSAHWNTFDVLKVDAVYAKPLVWSIRV